jgi:hypothetical protein
MRSNQGESWEKGVLLLLLLIMASAPTQVLVLVGVREKCICTGDIVIAL